MPANLVIISGTDKGRKFPLISGSTVIIGRGQASHTKLVDPQVSRNHCEVCLDGGRALVTDSGSVGGTFVNDQRITKKELRAGDVIRIGETTLRFENSVAEEATLPPTPIKDVAPAPAPGKEVVFAQKARGQTAVPRNLQELRDLVGKSLGVYKILKVLGTGTTGVVFLAQDSKDEKTVALKVLKADFVKDEKARQRFVRGIKTACTLKHPNLVSLRGAGITDSRCWIALEHIDGESLTQVMKAGKMEWPRARQVAIHIARGLGYIHDNGVIHRNVMPQNIMIQNRDHLAKLGDVMLAKALEDEGQEVTGSTELVGNIYYLAPERTVGKNDAVDGRADLYSLGATVYALLTGQNAVQGNSLIEVVTRIRTAKPESPRKFQSAIPDSFEAVVMKLLAKRPEDRFQSAAALLSELDKVQLIAE